MPSLGAFAVRTRSSSRTQLIWPFVVVAMLGFGGCSKPSELAPPLILSCAESLPTLWERGDIINLLSNGTASLANEKLRQQGKVMIIGKWQRVSSGYSITWNGVVRSTGQLSVFSDPSTMTVNFVHPGKASNGEPTVQMRAGNVSRRCLLGG
jgi:hypothetical protein